MQRNSRSLRLLADPIGFGRDDKGREALHGELLEAVKSAVERLLQSQGDGRLSRPSNGSQVSTALSFVIPSEAERPAVRLPECITGGPRLRWKHYCWKSVCAWADNYG